MPDMALNGSLSDPLAQSDLEIGIDTGEFLCQIASRHPDRLFVGVEIKPMQSALAAARVSNNNLRNAYVVNMEAFEYVNEWVGDGVFDNIHIYFPTPFPKSIGIDHPGLSCRLMRPEFIKQTHRILKTGGTLRLITDRKDYFQFACEGFDPNHWWAVDWHRLNIGQEQDQLIGTPTEKSLRESGNENFYTLQLIRYD